MNTTPNALLAEASPPPSAPTPRGVPPQQTTSQNTRQLVQNYSKLTQQVSEINQEQSAIERTAEDRRSAMHSLGIDVST
jgi:hypothetical protein